MTNKTLAPLLTLLIVILLTACSSNEIGDSKDVAQEKIYQYYSAEYSEGNTTVDIYSQFRFGGSNGTTLVLNKPSTIGFDNTILKVDSNKFGGAFYATKIPVQNFYGKHHFVFTNVEGKRFDNDFIFDSLKIEVPTTASKYKDLVIPFFAPKLKEDDYIEIATTVETDSSFSVRYTARDTGNKIIIPAKYLQKQKVVNIKLEAELVKQVPLQQNTQEGGKMQVSYKTLVRKINLGK